jgi:ethanolamine ammonia-lyase large subunit
MHVDTTSYYSHTLPKYLYQDKPQIAIIRARLRINRTSLNHTVHRYANIIPSFCLYCYVNHQQQHEEDVNHLLMICPKYHIQRQHLTIILTNINIYHYHMY